MKNLNLFKTENHILKYLTNHGDIVSCIIQDTHENVISQYPLCERVSVGYCDAIIINHIDYDRCEPKETLLVLKILAKAKLIT